MADAAFGARPVREKGHPGYATNRYYADVSDALYVGDIVALEGTADSEGVPSVIACTPSLLPVGIITAIEPSKDIPEDQLYKKAGDAVYLTVADSPNLVFHIQADDTVAATDIGQQADLVFTEGDTNTGRSKMELDVGTLAASAALHMTLERLAQLPDNSLSDTNPIIECSFKQHSLGKDAGV